MEPEEYESLFKAMQELSASDKSSLLAYMFGHFKGAEEAERPVDTKYFFGAINRYVNKKS